MVRASLLAALRQPIGCGYVGLDPPAAGASRLLVACMCLNNRCARLFELPAAAYKLYGHIYN